MIKDLSEYMNRVVTSVWECDIYENEEGNEDIDIMQLWRNSIDWILENIKNLSKFSISFACVFAWFALTKKNQSNKRPPPTTQGTNRPR